MLQALLNSQGSVPLKVIIGCTLIIVLAFSLSIHEFMHGYVAYRLGDDTAKLQGRLTLNPMAHLDPLGSLMMIFAGFGWAKPVPVNYGRLTRLKNRNISVRLVSVAGVFSNFIVAWISYIFYSIIFQTGISTGLFLNVSSEGLPVSAVGMVLFIVCQLFYFLYVYNLILMAFNLLPIPPLDGYHFAETFVPYKWRPQLAAYEKYAVIILLILVVVSNFSSFSPLGSLIGLIETPFKYIITTPVDYLTSILF